MKLLPLFFLFISHSFMFSQEIHKTEKIIPEDYIIIMDNDTIYSLYSKKIDKKAFCFKLFDGFILKNMIPYPSVEKTIHMKFIVRKDSTISDFTIIDGTNDIWEETMKKVIYLTSGEWEPAIVNGKPVSSFYKHTIEFKDVHSILEKSQNKSQ